AELFEAETAARFARCFETLLASIVAAPERAVSELALLSPDERRWLVVDCNATAVPHALRPVHERIEEQVDRTPAAPAVRFGEVTWSYAELDRRANRLARALAAAGVGRESLVAVMAEPSAERVAAL